MGGKLITIGTDGLTNWVSAADGKRYNLGVMSVLKFVTDLLPPKKAVSALDTFLTERSVMVVVDSNKLEKTFARMAAQNPSMSHSGEDSMATIQDKLTKIERHVEALNKAAAKQASNLHEGIGILVKLASELKAHDVTADFSDFIKEKKEEKEDEEKSSKAAATIIEKAAAVVERIDTLVAQGKKFNASKARQDVRTVTVRIASALRSGDSAAVGKIAGEMDKIHSLFFPTK